MIFHQKRPMCIENVSPGALIKSGVLFAWIRYVESELKNETRSKIGHKKNIHIYCPILMKLGENNHLMS